MKKLILLVATLATTIASAQDGFFHNGRKLYPEKFAQTKTGGAFAAGLTYGITKAKTKSYLAKPWARTNVKPNPEFVLKIQPVYDAGVQTGQLWAHVQSPEEFALVQFNIHKKKGRWLQTGEFGLYSGITMSPDPKDFIYFEWTEGEEDNTFDIKTNLKSGQYAFIYIGSITAYANQAVYTFGVE